MLSFPSSSLYFPAALRYGKHILLLQVETCGKTQNNKELQTKQQKYRIFYHCEFKLGKTKE